MIRVDAAVGLSDGNKGSEVKLHWTGELERVIQKEESKDLRV